MENIHSICVYCGSSSRVDEVYKQAARDLGVLCAEKEWTVVYGGGSVGLMGILADTTMDNGGRVIGVIPEHLQKMEVMQENITEHHIVSSMHERKMMMAERADAFIVLPGGLGTMDEFFEIVTWKQLGLHGCPVLLVNRPVAKVG